MNCARVGSCFIGGRNELHPYTIPFKIQRTEVGTVFIASAVERITRWLFMDRWNRPPPALHFHGGRDEDGPYLGSLELNDITIPPHFP
jgi:hypothetical protein